MFYLFARQVVDLELFEGERTLLAASTLALPLAFLLATVTAANPGALATNIFIRLFISRDLTTGDLVEGAFRLHAEQIGVQLEDVLSEELPLGATLDLRDDGLLNLEAQLLCLSDRKIALLQECVCRNFSCHSR